MEELVSRFDVQLFLIKQDVSNIKDYYLNLHSPNVDIEIDDLR